jgi:hypothetical protein
MEEDDVNARLWKIDELEGGSRRLEYEIAFGQVLIRRNASKNEGDDERNRCSTSKKRLHVRRHELLLATKAAKWNFELVVTGIDA